MDLKNEAYNVYETTQKQLDEFRSKLPAEEIGNIEKALSNLNEWKDKDLQVSDIDNVKNAISEARNAAMKIGQVMYNQSSGQSSSSESTNTNEDEKKNNWLIDLPILYFVK